MSGLGRIAFLGTGPFGVPLLERLSAEAEDLLVISQPDRPAGRGLRWRASAVAEWARDHDLRVEAPRRLRSDEGRGLLHEFAPDGLLLAAYGQLVPTDLLDAFSRMEPTSDPLRPQLLATGRHAQDLGYAPAGDLAGLVDPAVLEEAHRSARR